MDITNILQVLILVLSTVNVVLSIFTLVKIKDLCNAKTKTEQVLSQFK